MNPFDKLKLTIERVNLEYLPTQQKFQQIPNKQSHELQQTMQDVTNEQANLPYFTTSYEQKLKNRTQDYCNYQLDELKSVYDIQQKSYLNQITQLNKKLETSERKILLQEKDYQYLTKQINSLEKQNEQLRLSLQQIQQKNQRKSSQSNYSDRERKYKEQIDRINSTVTELATNLNSQKLNKKTILKQNQTLKFTLSTIEFESNRQKLQFIKEIQTLKIQLQQRNSLLEHSIRTSADDKLNLKKQVQNLKAKYQNKIDHINRELNEKKDQIYILKSEIIHLNCQNQNITKNIQEFQTKIIDLSQSLINAKIDKEKMEENERLLKNSLEETKLQLYYQQTELQQERNNIKVKVVEVKDETVELQLCLYKKQYKQLLKQKSIWQSVQSSQYEYTIIQNQNN